MAKMDEDRWTERLAKFYVHSERIPVGPGEDCVHLREVPGREMVVSIDAHREGVHFTLEFLNLRDVGHRSLALALSDLASVGAAPLTYLINLEVPPHLGLEQTVEIYHGFRDLNQEYCISPSGGNLTRGERLGLTLVVLGEVKAQQGLLRSQAQEGDYLVVTGDLGRSAAGLMLLKNPDLRRALGSSVVDPLVDKFRNPWPRIKDMEYILQLARVNAAIDITDGLGKDLFRMAKRSDVEIVIYEDRLPLHEALLTFTQRIHADPTEFAVASGEELEVAFTLPPEEFQKIENLRVPVTVIGEVRPGFVPGVLLRRKSGEEIPVGHLGYDHLAT